MLQKCTRKSPFEPKFQFKTSRLAMNNHQIIHLTRISIIECRNTASVYIKRKLIYTNTGQAGHRTPDTTNPPWCVRPTGMRCHLTNDVYYNIATCLLPPYTHDTWYPLQCPQPIMPAMPATHHAPNARNCILQVF